MWLDPYVSESSQNADQQEDPPQRTQSLYRRLGNGITLGKVEEREGHRTIPPHPCPSPPEGIRIKLSTTVCQWGGESLDTDSHRFTQIDSITARWLCTYPGRHRLFQDPTSPLKMGRNAQGHSYQRRERTKRKGVIATPLVSVFSHCSAFPFRPFSPLIRWVSFLHSLLVRLTPFDLCKSV